MQEVRGLSKSRILSGWQCKKKLWLETHAPEHAETSAMAERNFALGHQVGELARRLFPGGVLVGHDRNLEAALAETEARLAEPGPVTLFEAAFRHDDVLVRVDILIRDEHDRIRLIEVKAGTAIKPVNYVDCAVQAWVLARIGLPADRVELAHVDNRFVYPGGDDYDGILVIEDLTERVAQSLAAMSARVHEDRALLRGPMPDIDIGPQCKNPYECQFLAWCTPPQAEYPVRSLPGGGKAMWELIEAGFEDIREIPAGRLSSATQEWVRRVTVDGRPELKPAAAQALAALGWPRYYLDFETVSFAIPVWAGTRPYQPLPFQWSCHVESHGGTLEHREWLADGSGPPMRGCAEALIEALGDEGPVLTYTGYEAGVLSQLCTLYPDLASDLTAIGERLFDLHPVTRQNYYHPDMRGSWSIKAVLPTIAPDMSYETLGEVRVGTAASDGFLELMSADTGEERRQRLRADLLAYCAHDTQAMVRLAAALQGEPAAGEPARRGDSV